MSIQLPSDLRHLRAECDRRFGGKPIIHSVVAGVLRALEEDVWADEQGIPTATADLIQAELAGALEDVFDAQDTLSLLGATDRLAIAWDNLKPRIVIC